MYILYMYIYIYIHIYIYIYYIYNAKTANSFSLLKPTKFSDFSFLSMLIISKEYSVIFSKS